MRIKRLTDQDCQDIYDFAMERSDELQGRPKHFIECLFDDLDDIYEGTDAEVEQELLDAGIDVETAKKQFLELLATLKGGK